LFQKFHVLCVTNGVHQKYLRIVCITMIQNELMNLISVYWKKVTGMSYIIKSWTDGPYNNWNNKCTEKLPVSLLYLNIYMKLKKKHWYHGTWLTCCVRNCPPLSRRQHIIEKYVTHNRIVKAVTLPKVYLNLLLVQEFPQRHAKLGISQKCVTYFSIMCW
jgi:hypothetical protein